MLDQLLRRIAQTKPHAPPLTPLTPSPGLSELSGSRVLLKCEHVLPTGAFKLRGAVHKLAMLGAAAKAGVVTASTGNHGMAVSYAGRAAGAPVRVFVAESAPAGKIGTMRALGAEVSIVEGAPLAAETTARAFAAERGLTYISPYNDLDVMAGHAAIGREILDQAPETDAILVSVGGGGLLGGVGAAAKAIKPTLRMVGCWPENAAGLLRSIEAGKIIEEPEAQTLSEATAGGAEEGSVTFPICQAVLDEAVLVSEAEIARAMRMTAARDHWIIEGAAGVAVAGALQRLPSLQGKTIAVVLCGRNVALEVFLSAISQPGLA